MGQCSDRLKYLFGRFDLIGMPQDLSDIANGRRHRWPILPRLDPVFRAQPLMLRGPRREQI
jgi:hypothetical protein